jgi:hypothetical protein
VFLNEFERPFLADARTTWSDWRRKQPGPNSRPQCRFAAASDPARLGHVDAAQQIGFDFQFFDISHFNGPRIRVDRPSTTLFFAF